MNITRQTIITATAAISKMTDNTREQILYEILNDRPTAAINAMKAYGIKFEEETTKADPEQLYKVAITSLEGENRKICVIKCVREILGYGLSDAKAWCEGGKMAPDQLPSGIFGQHLTYNAARNLFDRVKKSFSNSGNLFPRVEILTDGYFVKPLPSIW